MRPDDSYQTQLTFAMARHAAVDLAWVLRLPPRDPEHDRFPAPQRQRLEREMAELGVALRQGVEVEARLAELRGTYEPFLQAMARRFLFALPPLMPEERGWSALPEEEGGRSACPGGYWDPTVSARPSP
ncbi:MAG TPA: hypothetical protein VGQ83_19945 [Polyangia bacterium]